MALDVNQKKFKCAFSSSSLVCFRDEIPSVILYDTSQDEDVNINEAILQAVRDDDGGIDTPRTLSPAPGSTPSTPKQVISPGQSATNITVVKSSSSQNIKTSDSRSSDSLHARGSEKLDSGENINLTPVSQIVNQTEIIEASVMNQSKVTETSVVKQTEIIEPLVMNQSKAAETSLVNQTEIIDSSVVKGRIDVGNAPDLGSEVNEIQSISKTAATDQIPSDEKLSKKEEIETVPRFTASWTNPSVVTEDKKGGEMIDFNSVANRTEISTESDGVQAALNKNIVNNFESLSLSNENVSKDYVIEKDSPMPKQWSLDGRTIWNPVEYSKRPLPPNFEIPPVGEYVDIHVNCIHDPSNFVVSLNLI